MSDVQPHVGGDEERSRFLATMSHDIRTPLTALRGALGLLERKELPPEILQQMIAMLRRSSDRLERLVMGLVTIDLIDSGTMSILREVSDLRDVVRDAVAITAREHPSIEVTVPDEPVEVVLDRERTLQALDHILDNARKFGGPEGTVRVEVCARGGRGVIRVSDDGPGIPEIDRRRVFDRYVQIGERLANEPRGAGVGLYLAAWNLTAIEGSVTVVEGGPGATLELSLPRVDSLPR